MSVAAQVGRGPLAHLLQSAGTQWMVLGLVGISLVGGGDKFRAVLHENLLKVLLTADGGAASSSAHARGGGGMAPIVIHTTGGSDARSGSSAGSYIFLALQVSMGAATCWAAYGLLATAMPQAVKEIMPVSRKFFDRAVKSLGEGIIAVQTTLTQQIGLVEEKQDELSHKQDQTLQEVIHVRGDLGQARDDLRLLHESLRNCQDSLHSSQGLSDYTARGVRLLVRCVASIMPGNDRVLQELAQYIREAETLQKKNGDSNSHSSNSAMDGHNSPPALPVTPEDEHPVMRQSSSSMLAADSSTTPSSGKSGGEPRHDSLTEIHSLLGMVNETPIKAL